MGLFSIFRKRTPEDVYRSVAQKIVLASLRYRQDLSAPNHQLSADAGAEMVYLLLHFVDREAFQLLGTSQRDTVFDEISKIVIADYASSVLITNAPQDALLHVAEQMMNALGSRQSIYAQCDSLVGGEGFPSRGTMVFAFCFFVHRALGNTTRSDVDDILIGKRDLSDSDLDDFPDLRATLHAAIFVGSTLEALRIPNDLKYLKRTR